MMIIMHMLMLMSCWSYQAPSSSSKSSSSPTPPPSPISCSSYQGSLCWPAGASHYQLSLIHTPAFAQGWRLLWGKGVEILQTVHLQTSYSDPFAQQTISRLQVVSVARVLVFPICQYSLQDTLTTFVIGGKGVWISTEEKERTKPSLPTGTSHIPKLLC